MEPNPSQSPGQFVISARFDDFDQFEEFIRLWDLDFCQLDRGSFHVDLTQLVTSSVLVSDFNLSRRIEQRGQPPEGFRTFGIPADDSFFIRWRGKDIGPDNLILFPPGAELDCISEPGFRAISLSVSERELEEAAERRGLPSTNALFPNSETVLCQPGTRRHLCQLAHTLMKGATQDPEVLNNPWFRISLEEHLIESLLTAISSGIPCQGTSRLTATRRKALNNALVVISEAARDPISVTDLESLSGTSGRTLRYAFKEAYGLSPGRYLHTYRLNRIHRELSRNDSPGLTVSEVAKSWGIWHMGKFAGDYRSMFGKSPSETLAGTKSGMR